MAIAKENKVVHGSDLTLVADWAESRFALKSALSGYLPLAGGTMSNTNLVTNLNADLLDGKHDGELYANGLRYYGHTTTATRLTAGDTLSFDADTGMHYYIITSRMADNGRPGADGYGVQMEWDSADWRTQFWVHNSDTDRATYGDMKIRHQNNASTWGDWHTFAMLDSNVASATKLQTPRSIWGQSFDGTADISGAMTGVTTVNSFINAARGDSVTAYLFLTNVYASVDYAHIFVSNQDKSATHRPLVLQNGYGNVGVGIPNPSYKLDVAGDIRGTSVTTTLQTSQPSGGMLPNCQYALGELSGDTTFSMAAGSSGVTNHYFWTFSTGSTAPTITWPAAITSWFGGSAPTISASKHYEVSVLDGVAICMEV